MLQMLTKNWQNSTFYNGMCKVRANALELSSILSKKKISVACLQETLLGDSNWCPTKKYKLEKSPHIGGAQNRGVAI